MEKFFTTHNQGVRILNFLDNLGRFNYTSASLEHAFFMGICGIQERRDSMRGAKLSLR